MKSAAKLWRERGERLKYAGKRGAVVSWTKILESPVGFEADPYIVVMVRVGKEIVVGQLTDLEEPVIGEKVVAVIRRLGIAQKGEVLEYGVKWKKA